MTDESCSGGQRRRFSFERAHVGRVSVAGNRQACIRALPTNEPPRIEQQLHVLHGMQARDEYNFHGLSGGTRGGSPCLLDPGWRNDERSIPPLDAVPHGFLTFHIRREVKSGDPPKI